MAWFREEPRQTYRNEAHAGASVPRGERRIWSYDVVSGYWWLGDETLRFKLTDQRQKKFLGTIAADDEEDVLHLLDILRDATHLEFEVSEIRLYSKFQFWFQMFVGVLQIVVENPAPALQYLKVRLDGPEVNDQVSGSEYLDHLITGLRWLDRLRVLDLSGYSFEGRHVAIARAIESGHLQALQDFHLQETRLGDSDCEVYGQALESGMVGSLCRIDFSKNWIGKSGATALGRAFESGKVTHLQHLLLERNNIGDDGVIALGNAFKSGQVENLNTIDLSGNNFGDNAMVALATSFGSGHLKNLHAIDLRANNVGDDGMALLADALGSGEFPNLRELHLGDNRVEVRGIRCLARVLESGNLNCLSTLHLENSLTEESTKYILQALSKNTLLTVEIFDHVLDARIERQRERNLAHIRLLAAAGGREVAATFGKVYLCGNPEVGKTTLRKSLKRTPAEALLIRERREHVEPRTRGIDICRIISKGGKHGKNPVSLTVWDMAGQNDYHMLHNAFLPDLAYSEGKATIFVVMCSSETALGNAEIELENWFKFIASSVSKISDIRQDVFVVVNRMNGDPSIMGKATMTEWKRMLSTQALKFENCLKIKEDPFVMDVRKRDFVQPFKESLFDRSRELLDKVKVPEICRNIQDYLNDLVQTRKQFPVLPWIQVQTELRRRRAEWPEETLEAAVKYLNEAGLLIYINKKSSQEWCIPDEKLVVVDPNWFCKEILGSMFMPAEIGSSSNGLFRDKVDQNTGSILISDFKKAFVILEGGAWNNSELDRLLAILLWLGFCFKGSKDNIFIPALINEDDEERKRKVSWKEGAAPIHRQDGQWVMGFSVEHVTSQTALAPMALWHRFEVELAQIPKFNGQTLDTDFVAGKYFVTFIVDYMLVLIQVNANESQHPTFNCIEVLVKPLLNYERDVLDKDTRKQRQVDMAGDIVKILVGLWNEVCPAVEYVHRVVWPWPVSQPRPPSLPQKNLQVAKLKSEVKAHGRGRAMQWAVGEHEVITEDQLLSTADKEGMKNFLSTEHKRKEKVGNEASSAQSWARGAAFDRLLELLEETLKVSRESVKENWNVNREMRQMLEDFQRTFLEDRESTCPKIMYVGRRNSSAWMRLRVLQASPIVNVHVHFLCEANFNDDSHQPHEVPNQEGIDVSQFRDWARKLAPWIIYSAKFLLTAAKIGANFVAPGIGLAIPNFTDWQQISSLSDGILAVTGFTEKELDELNKSDWRSGKASPSQHDPEELYGQSKKFMAEILRKLTVQEWKDKVGLQKVCLKNVNGSLIGVRWICNECFQKYRSKQRLSEL